MESIGLYFSNIDKYVYEKDGKSIVELKKVENVALDERLCPTTLKPMISLSPKVSGSSFVQAGTTSRTAANNPNILLDTDVIVVSCPFVIIRRPGDKLRIKVDRDVERYLLVDLKFISHCRKNIIESHLCSDGLIRIIGCAAISSLDIGNLNMWHYVDRFGT